MSQECPNVSRCPMFPVFSEGSRGLAVLKEIYCFDGFDRCERYRSMQSGKVPAKTMLPSGKTLRVSDGNRGAQLDDES